MHYYYVIKRKFAGTYYTVRTERNVPAIMAFPYAKPAKAMLNTILAFEKHPQPLVVEKVDEDTLVSPCRRSFQPVVLFTAEGNLELQVPLPADEDMDRFSNIFYLERKYRK